MTEVKIADVTLKQAHAKGSLNLSFKEKLEIAKLLDRLCASVIEIEGIENANVDTLRIKSIASAVKNTTLAAPVKLDASDVKLVWKSLAEAKDARLQVSASLSAAQMEYIHGIKADAMSDVVCNAIKECKKLTDNVEFIAEDATRADAEILRECVRGAIKAGAATVTLCDAAGAMMPEQFGEFVTNIKKDVPELESVVLGIAYSNEHFMANACGVAAIQAGAQEVKATMHPLNTISTLEIANILNALPEAFSSDIKCNVRTTEIKRISSQIENICGVGVQHTNASAAGCADAQDIELTEHDSLDAVVECAKRLGYDLTPEDSVDVYAAFLRIAKKKEVVGSRELDTIVAATSLQVPPTYNLKDYVFTSGNTIHAMARVTLEFAAEDAGGASASAAANGTDANAAADMSERVGIATGDGPIDASFMAIENIVGRHFELDDFQIRAVTEGRESVGETVVKLLSDGKLYSGKGVSTDIVGSAIRAYVNAVNKIVYEEKN